MISRRNFVKRSAQWIGSSLLLSNIQACATKPSTFQSRIVGPNSELGHRLRTPNFDAPTEIIKTDIAIIGGGISGLSAARYLKKFTNNFMLLEMGDEVGGNATAGSNAVSAYPWGAHYLPVPGTNDKELISFLEESNVITGYENALPVYNEYYLCFDPKERLYINHYWQDGILPNEGVPQKDRDELDRFTALMHDFKIKTGNDGKEAFAIPLDNSSQDATLLELDDMSMASYLEQHRFKSPYLRWYVNYCCADDYGSTIDDTSAWAGIHYFASRKSKSANASSDAVLTWPEGNYWLVKQLKKNISDHILTNTLAYEVAINNSDVEIKYYDASSNTSKKLIAKKVILATPQFINQRLLSTSIRPIDLSSFQYAPWMVANITTNADLNEKHGDALCWDNVLFGSNSLGYVDATHQQVSRNQTEKVITYYQPLTGGDARTLRQQAQQKTAQQWTEETLRDLRGAHPTLEKNISQFDIWIWGHGMIKPSIDFIWSANRKNASHVIDNKIHFAHSDLSGISIFEEAFFHGHRAAQKVLDA